jgi:hypothetical protein
MRCHQARQRLIAPREAISKSGADTELQEHLRSCPACAALAETELRLRRDLELATADDNIDVIGLAALRSQVEGQVPSVATQRSTETNLMTKIANKLKSRPRLGITLGAVVALLLIATLVPLKMDQTVGYQVALAGVDKDLAMDNEKIQVLLDALGCSDADIIVGDCAATCQLTISDLKTEGDVQRIVLAFDELGNCVLESVSEMTEDGDISVYSTARIEFLSNNDDFEAQRVVTSCLEQLSSDTNCAFSIWMAKSDDEDGGPTVITMDLSGGFADANFNTFIPDLDGSGQIFVEKIDGSNIMTWTYEDGVVHTIDLTDPDAQSQVQALGGNAFFISTDDSDCGPAGLTIRGDSAICKMIWCDPGKCLKKVEEIDGDAAKVGDDALPSEFVLSQNYPNPFNPSTEIKFNVPRSQAVSLKVFNIQGQLVKTLIDETVSAGEHIVQWNGDAESGNAVASGVYLYRLVAGDFSETKKMSLVK